MARERTEWYRGNELERAERRTDGAELVVFTPLPPGCDIWDMSKQAKKYIRMKGTIASANRTGRDPVERKLNIGRDQAGMYVTPEEYDTTEDPYEQHKLIEGAKRKPN